MTDLYVQFNKIVKDNCWKHFFQDEDGKKMKIRFLVNAIEPAELKTMIKNKLKVEPRFSKQPVAFLELLREKTNNHEESRTVWETGQETKKKKDVQKRPRSGDGKLRESKKKTDAKQGGGQDRSQLKCFNCGKFGHPAFKCKEAGGISRREVHKVLKKNDNTFRKNSNYLRVCRIGSSPYEQKN